MKILWLLSLLYAFVLADQTQIVVGSYSNIQNATRAQEELNTFIKKDANFQKFFTKHSLVTKYRAHEKYFRVVVEPFNDLQTQDKALKKFKAIFKDAYVLKIEIQEKNTPKEKSSKKPIIKKPVVEKVVTEKIVPKKVIAEKPVLQKPVVEKIIVQKPIVQNEPILQNEITEKQTSSKVLDQEMISDDTLAVEEPEEVISKVEAEVKSTDMKTAQTGKKELVLEEKNDDMQTTNYLILIIVVLITFIIIMYFLRIGSKYKKRNEKDELLKRMIDRQNSRRAEEENAIKNSDWNKDEPLTALDDRLEDIDYDAFIDDVQDDTFKNEDKLREKINKS